MLRALARVSPVRPEVRRTGGKETNGSGFCGVRASERTSEQEVAERKSAESLRSRIGPVTESGDVRGVRG
jgi:hypothetical protein